MKQYVIRKWINRSYLEPLNSDLTPNNIANVKFVFQRKGELYSTHGYLCDPWMGARDLKRWRNGETSTLWCEKCVAQSYHKFIPIRKNKNIGYLVLPSFWSSTPPFMILWHLWFDIYMGFIYILIATIKQCNIWEQNSEEKDLVMH